MARWQRAWYDSWQNLWYFEARDDWWAVYRLFESEEDGKSYWEFLYWKRYDYWR